MGLTVTDTGGGDFQLPPEGTHLAVCYMVVDLGMQDTHFGLKHQVRLAWELADERMDDGRPFSVSKNYTASLNEKSNLRQDLERWRSKTFTSEELEGFDLKNVAGKPCLVTITHKVASNDKTYANVTAVSGILRSMTAPQRTNELVIYDPDDPQHRDMSKLPEWLQDKIGNQPAKSEHQAQDELADSMPDDLDDDVPF